MLVTPAALKTSTLNSQNQNTVPSKLHSGHIWTTFALRVPSQSVTESHPPAVESVL